MVDDVYLVGVSHMVPSLEELKPGLPPALDGDRVVRWKHRAGGHQVQFSQSIQGRLEGLELVRDEQPIDVL